MPRVKRETPAPNLKPKDLFSNNTKPKENPTSTNVKTESAPVPTEFVEKAAYYHWEKRGKPAGDEWYDWLEAEKEIKEWMSASGLLPPQKNQKK
jgi:hypothetical protein